MGCYLLIHAYNHFDTHEAQHHDTIFNHHIYYIAISMCITNPYFVLVPCMPTHVHACVCGYVCVCVYAYMCTSEFKSPRVCQDILQELYI